MPEWLTQIEAPWWVAYGKLGMIYIGSSLAAFIHVQFVKLWRWSTCKKKLSDWHVRALSVFSSGSIALFVSNRICELPLDISFDNAISVAIFYPLIMFLLNLHPKVAEKLKTPYGDPYADGDKTIQ